jgi:hypothetical protein
MLPPGRRRRTGEGGVKGCRSKYVAHHVEAKLARRWIAKDRARQSARPKSNPAAKEKGMSKMRAKMRVWSVSEHLSGQDGEGDRIKQGETLRFNAVGASSYPEDGGDENNTFAKFTPSASVEIYVANPALFGAFKVDEQYYVDFTPAA